MTRKRLILVGGGARSGKSTFALNLARRLGPRRLFLAPACAGDQEMVERIQRHQAERGPGFTTREEPLAVCQALQNAHDFDVVLFDCLTLWLSNLLLEGHDADAVFQKIDNLAEVLRTRTGHVIVVTNEVGLGLVPETPLGRTFRDVAGQVHQRLSALADEVYFSVLGTMLRLKPALGVVSAEEAAS